MDIHEEPIRRRHMSSAVTRSGGSATLSHWQCPTTEWRGSTTTQVFMAGMIHDRSRAVIRNVGCAGGYCVHPIIINVIIIIGDAFTRPWALCGIAWDPTGRAAVICRADTPCARGAPDSKPVRCLQRMREIPGREGNWVRVMGKPLRALRA
jgi:hypothetical protein